VPVLETTTLQGIRLRCPRRDLPLVIPLAVPRTLLLQRPGTRLLRIVACLSPLVPMPASKPTELGIPTATTGPKP
jgi:hypothetical protein